MKSIWEKDLNESKNNQSVKGIYKKDIIVVGGGIAGLMCAYALSESGHSVTLIEAQKILSGVTVNTTAHITALQARYTDIPSKKRRAVYFRAQIQGVDGIESIVKKHNINCDFKRVDSLVFGDGKNKKHLQKEFKVLKKINAPVTFLENQNFAFGNFDAIKLENQAQFNPVKFLQALPKNFEIIEDTRIKKVSLLRKTLYSDNAVFKANKIIFASNFPIANIRGLYAFKMYKSTSYAIYVNTTDKLNAIYNAISGDGLSYRDTEQGIIIGGLDHRTGRIKSCEQFKRLEEHARVFNGEVTNKWTANDCMTFDSFPFSGKFKRLCSRNIYLISGFAKWGMANSYTAAKVIDDLVNNKRNEFTKAYKPARIYNVKVWARILQNMCYDVFNIAKSFLGITFKRAKSLKNGDGGIVCYHFKKRAIYKDEYGKLHIVSPHCPHMGCQLKFNPNTKSWDCPCHGSRLTIDGDIITAPTVRDNKI